MLYDVETIKVNNDSPRSNNPINVKIDKEVEHSAVPNTRPNRREANNLREGRLISLLRKISASGSTFYRSHLF